MGVVVSWREEGVRGKKGKGDTRNGEMGKLSRKRMFCCKL